MIYGKKSVTSQNAADLSLESDYTRQVAVFIELAEVSVNVIARFKYAKGKTFQD